MSTAKIKPTLPKEDWRNGLDELAGLANEPGKVRWVIMAVDCGETKLAHAEDSGDFIPPGVTAVLRIRQVEAVLPGDERAAKDMLLRSRERRTTPGAPALFPVTGLGGEE